MAKPGLELRPHDAIRNTIMRMKTRRYINSKVVGSTGGDTPSPQLTGIWFRTYLHFQMILLLDQAIAFSNGNVNDNDVRLMLGSIE